MKFFLLLILLSFSAWSQDSRWIDIEWEEVANASNYEVELFQEENGKQLPRGKFKVDQPGWSSAVPPGKYSLRIRSLDKRGVPGEWSEYIPVKVRMHNPKLFQPGPASKLSSPQVEFEWSDVVGAAMYQLVVKNEKDQLAHNSIVRDVRASVYLEELGNYTWTAYALEEGEAQRTQEDFTASTFRGFIRVGGELDPPEVKVTVKDKVIIEWNKVRRAKTYELDYLPPANADKSRRFKLPGNSFAFATKRLREGITTITLRSSASGYPDSRKSIIQLQKSGSTVEIQDIIQGSKEDEMKTSPSKLEWKDELLVSMTLAKFAYSSTDVEKDTELDQKELTGLGLNLEWMNKPKLNALQRRVEVNYLQLSSGRESASKIRGSFSLRKARNLGKGTFAYGGGVTVLKLPAFMGDRFEDDIFVEQSTTLGPHISLSYLRPLTSYWATEARLLYSQQLMYLSSDRDGGSSFGWMAIESRMFYYISKKESLFLGLDYQRWAQKWSSDESELSGFTMAIGLKAGF